MTREKPKFLSLIIYHRSSPMKTRCIETTSRVIEHKYRRGEILDMFISKFTKKEVEHYKNIGCSLQAIWTQDKGMQLSYWGMVQSFAESKGLTMRIKSVLD